MLRVRLRKRLRHNDNPRSAKDAFISQSVGWVVWCSDLSAMTPTLKWLSEVMAKSTWHSPLIGQSDRHEQSIGLRRQCKSIVNAMVRKSFLRSDGRSIVGDVHTPNCRRWPDEQR